jgi:hypothetical protein
MSLARLRGARGVLPKSTRTNGRGAFRSRFVKPRFYIGRRSALAIDGLGSDPGEDISASREIDGIAMVNAFAIAIAGPMA